MKIFLILIIIFNISFSQIRVPAEWETQDAVWLQWPLQFEHWMRSEIAETISTIQNYESVHLIVQNQNHLTQAQNQIQNQGGDPDDVTYHIQIHNNAWLRDNGPVYVESDDQLIIQNMEFDGWGGLVNNYEEDNEIPCQIAEWLSMDCENLDFIMERGNLEFNGSGTLISNWDCWEDRNPNLNQTELESLFMEYWGLSQIIWTYGHSQYDVTTGHIDGLARFINDSTVAVSQFSDFNDEDAWISDAAADVIENAGFDVIRVEMPGYINYYGFIIPALYLNYLMINGAIIGNKYNVSEWDIAAQNMLESLFPNHEVILLYTPEVNLSGGGIHCITNDQPNFNPQVSFNFEYIEGWNLIGLPLEISQNIIEIIYPDAIPGSAYSFDGNYYQVNSLDNGNGVWLRFENEGSDSLNGIELNSITVILNEGWNLITGPSMEAEIIDTQNIIIIGSLYGFNGNYFEVNFLIPGNGYWIRAVSDGEIMISEINP